MARTIKATEAVRDFSEILNSVKYKGESYMIIRGGKPAAALVPVERAGRPKALKELRAVVKSLPRLGKDAPAFMSDIEEAVRKQPQLPEKSAWE